MINYPAELSRKVILITQFFQFFTKSKKVHPRINIRKFTSKEIQQPANHGVDLSPTGCDAVLHQQSASLVEEGVTDVY